jgi:uracil-DNA glycosylase
MHDTILLNESWKICLNRFLAGDEMASLMEFLDQQAAQKKKILPDKKNWFNCFNSTSPHQVKVVILGQDPYPTVGHAHGLCFSVQPEVKPLPKSLINIYKELYDDLGINNTKGCLQSWANQGVLLLNSVLTVESGHTNSHQGKGWELFTDAVIKQLNNQSQPIAFVLWGAYAQKKGVIINKPHHFIIRSPHPSPLSAYRGFWGSHPFSKINQFLQQQGQQPIDWKIT